MKKYSFIIVCLIFVLSGCPDPPLYETPLPNGYVHHSNGGEFGFITRPNEINGGPIKPLAMQDDGKEFWCNDFGVQKEWVICEVIEYAKRFVDPPISKHYLVLDTKTGDYNLYKSKTQLESEWEKSIKLPVPELKRKHENRNKI